MASQPENPEFRKNSENFYPCIPPLKLCCFLSWFVILAVSSLNSLKFKHIRGNNSYFRKIIGTKLQTHHHTLAINIHYVHLLKCYGSETLSSKQVKCTDSTILEDLLMKLLKYHHTMVIHI